MSATIEVSETASATFETRPVPNQRITIGAKAILGTLLIATTKGSTRRATKGEYHRPKPNTDPASGPRTKPRIASKSVVQVSSSSDPLKSETENTFQMPTGEPTRKGEIIPARAPASHAARNRTTNAVCMEMLTAVGLMRGRAFGCESTAGSIFDAAIGSFMQLSPASGYRAHGTACGSNLKSADRLAARS